MNKQAIFEGRKQILLFLPGPWIMNSLLAILKILELEQWTNRNQEFIQWTHRKQQGLQRNSVDLCPLNVNSPMFSPSWETAVTHLIRGAFWKFKKQDRYRYLFTSSTRTVHILSKYLNFILCRRISCFKFFFIKHFRSSARYGAVSRRVCEALCSTAC